MEIQELEIIIPRDGTIQVNVKGISGPTCLAVTKGLEQAAGTLVQMTHTAAYYQQDTAAELNRTLTGKTNGL